MILKNKICIGSAFQNGMFGASTIFINFFKNFLMVCAILTKLVGSMYESLITNFFSSVMPSSCENQHLMFFVYPLKHICDALLLPHWSGLCLVNLKKSRGHQRLNKFGGGLRPYFAQQCRIIYAILDNLVRSHVLP